MWKYFSDEKPAQDTDIIYSYRLNGTLAVGCGRYIVYRPRCAPSRDWGSALLPSRIVNGNERIPEGIYRYVETTDSYIFAQIDAYAWMPVTPAEYR